jgi:threonyl-tRNA synthetase
VIEKKMREIIQRNKPFTKEVWSRDKARQVFATRARPTRSNCRRDSRRQDVKIYFQGDWFDLCRGPHMASTGQIGSAFKLMKVAGAYWRGDSDNQMLTRIYGTAWADQKN